jgi:hypothetical protein
VTPSASRLNTKKVTQNAARGQTITKAEFLRQLAREIPAESFLPVEAAALVFGRLETARRIGRKAQIRLLMERSGIYSFPCRAQSENLYAPPRPSPSLSRLNRSAVFPPLLLPETTLPTVNLSAILGIVKRAHVMGESWPRLLDLLVTSSGLSWRTAARLLEGMTGRSIADGEITTVAQARQFWLLYAEGRARAVVLQTAKEMPVWRGDWAYFDREQFRALLPGAILPDHCERHEYLANYIHVAEQQGLDVYSLTAQPLFKHPFPLRLVRCRPRRLIRRA